MPVSDNPEVRATSDSISSPFAEELLDDGQRSHGRTGRMPDFQRRGDEEELPHPVSGQRLEIQDLDDVDPGLDQQVDVNRHGRIGVCSKVSVSEPAAKIRLALNHSAAGRSGPGER